MQNIIHLKPAEMEKQLAQLDGQRQKEAEQQNARRARQVGYSVQQKAERHKQNEILHNADQRLYRESNRLFPRALQQLPYSGKRLNIPAEYGKVRAQRHQDSRIILTWFAHQEREVQIEKQICGQQKLHDAPEPLRRQAVRQLPRDEYHEAGEADAYE